MSRSADGRGAAGGAALPDKQKKGVLVHKFGGVEYVEIARELNCSESVVKSLMFRAYEKLRVRLAHMAA